MIFYLVLLNCDIWFVGLSMILKFVIVVKKKGKLNMVLLYVDIELLRLIVLGINY